jgi:hypothetical protein
MFQFGAGLLFGNPLTTYGNPAGNPTPQLFGTLQDVNIEISQTLKELRGFNKFPDDVAPGDMKITGKAGFGKLEIGIFNNLFFGEASMATGVNIVQYFEADTIPAMTSFTITVAHATSPIIDLGVLYAATGKPFVKVPSAPTVGQYSVVLSTGVYTFASADASAPVLISYVYPSAMTGQTLTAQNHVMGYGPVWEMWLAQPYQGTNGLHLYACRSSKLGAPLKRADYQIGEMDFEAYASPSGLVADFFQVAN